MTDTRAPWSLRGRLTGRVLALVVGGWLVTIAVAAQVMTHEMNEMFDEELQALVETTVLYLDAADAAPIPRHLGVTTNDGERVLRILPASGPQPDAPWPALEGEGLQDAPGWRILRVHGEGAVIEAAHATAWRREEILEAASALLVLSLPLVALLLWGVRRTTSEATAPVSALASSVSMRKPDDFSAIDAGGLPSELRPLADAFNGYLGNIESLRKAERDFVANAAHELRTPLATIRGRLELSQDPMAKASVSLIDALTRRVERLLQLARMEAGVALGRGPTDALRVVQLLVDELRPRSRFGLRLDDNDLEHLLVAADTDALAILVRNLIENAIDHGDGEVWVRLTADGHLTVENPTKASDFAAERFGKSDASAGHGLGLSIVHSLSRALGVGMRWQIGQGQARIDLVLPLA